MVLDKELVSAYGRETINIQFIVGELNIVKAKTEVLAFVPDFLFVSLPLPILRFIHSHLSLRSLFQCLLQNLATSSLWNTVHDLDATIQRLIRCQALAYVLIDLILDVCQVWP